jgi:hypothetical protein
MNRRKCAAVVAIFAIGCGWASVANAQDKDDEVKAITARVHGTFQDPSGGLGVLSGDMTIARFEVRGGSLMAIGVIVGALADSDGNVLGQVDQELALHVENVASTCNQLRMDLAATDADVLETRVHFDKEVAGFDSRDGARPRTHDALCATGSLLLGKPTPDALTRALNNVVIRLASAPAQ